MIGDNIKKLRKSKGLLQKDLADVLNVTKAAVSSWETNRTTPDDDTKKRIADYFGVSLLKLYEYDMSQDITADEAELIDIYRRLNATGQFKMSQYAEDLMQIYRRDSEPKYTLSERFSEQ
jgi:transcriptional regulator with XRE-family HTH domain